MDSSLLMPHEDLARAREKLPAKLLLSYYLNYLKIIPKALFSDTKTKLDLGQSLFNGGCEVNIHYKYEFVEILRKLSFTVPEQVKFDSKNKSSIEEVVEFFRNHKKVLCKPEYGTMGAGIFVEEDEQNLVDLLEKTNQPYLVQSFMPPLHDYRYIYHRSNGACYRVCYEKTRPVVVGDGQSSIRDLIGSDVNIPKRMKKIILKEQRKRLDEVPDKGTFIELVDTGNISKGAYGLLIKDESLAAIDKLVLALIEDLRVHHGISLSTYCFDMGILNDNLHPDTISKDDVVFYEFQMPFAFSGYLDSREVDPVRKETSQLLKYSLQRNWIEREVGTEELESILSVSST